MIAVRINPKLTLWSAFGFRQLAASRRLALFEARWSGRRFAGRAPKRRGGMLRARFLEVP